MPWNEDGTRKKPSSYKMKYQGNPSAFPFKSKPPIMPKDHPVKHPTPKQMAKSKGTLRGITGFDYDTRIPTLIKRGKEDFKKDWKRNVQEIKTGIGYIKQTHQKIKDYFTKK